MMRGRLVSLALTALVLAGCSKPAPPGPKAVAVSGTVTREGRPLAKARVSYIPAGQTRGDGAFAITDDQGRYELKTVRGQPGAPAGTYRVTIAKSLMPDGSELPDNYQVAPADSPAKESLPSKYSSPEATTLTATVPDSGGTIDFKLAK